ncbi:hypothetical protein BDA96_03G339800 [Sorghum bicolor]|uniref:RRM domain-containing protein n=2 Tax=Sorghum bicolor TaxID=4558 RepID=A0A1W0VZV8_SORBI|nr:uncharacterized protein At1g27050 [Sorghum bicolor]KAG0539645.1 hypothetical protein BDA96_03G339800 [Sorghum bicolor]OQU87657.1 hypothetical protein SORBI_3003G315000 [Sorghum bicolor]OQU87658.1 hypothetical protein SORBI_3003G315000 [Sorghum bicolor]OQU87659.1 hypothetical protein SORBI_3003G315000 [Sorghum bicolor]|eukprot:XP_021312982.1 uncharacterized protein At1g27050 [Sorghum bicolor]
MTRRRRGKRGRTSPGPPTKRRRGGAPEIESDDYPEPVPTPAPAAPQPSSVMVAGLPPGCGVLELKSRLEAYGPIARARVDASAATGYVTFRSGAAAVAAIAASLDPGGGIAIGSKKVLVVQASAAPHNSIRAAESAGRSSHDATVKNVTDNSAMLSSKAASGVTYKAREIVAYDDLF